VDPVFALRVGAIVVGLALFGLAELRDISNEKKPFATGSERYRTFYDDATVFAMRCAGMGLVFISLISWVIGQHQFALR
jgi:hypothetical protein